MIVTLAFSVWFTLNFYFGMKTLLLLCLLLIGHHSIAQDQNVFTIARTGTVKEMTELWKSNPALIDSKNENGHTPLILATYRVNIEVAKFLIEKCKNINEKTDMGTALMAAVVKENKELTELLLLRGADPNLSDNTGLTALMYAAQFKNADLVNMLLKYKADPKIKNQDGKTASDFANTAGDKKIITLLNSH
jgi:uncharacterized protein